MMKYVAGFAVVATTAVTLSLIYVYKSINYDLDKVIKYNPPLTTQVYDTKGRLVANIFDTENRIYAFYNEFPSLLIEALIATEDTAFFEHKGVSFEAIMRAVIKDAIAGKAVEGASTLTQQLVKTMILTNEKSVSRKIKEAFIAFKVEEKLTKQEILERYLNQIYFGHGYYGAKSATLGYFHKNLNQLTLKEAAILTALPKAPSTFDPTKNYEGAIQRANAILNRMHYLGWVDDATHKKALAEQPVVYADGVVFNKAPYAVESAMKRLAEQFPDIKNGGYRIDLTIDEDLQEAADKALNKQYSDILTTYKNAKSLETFNGGVISVEQMTGDVLALSGGVNYAKSQFNRITQGKRQAGSSFKPFIYLVGMGMGMTPQTQLSDTPRSYTFGGKEWAPQNYDLKFEGIIPMREALVHSKNLATIDLVEKLGLNNVVQTLDKFGFKGLQKDLSIALGSYTVTPYDFSELYTIISNNGTKVTHRLVKSVRNRTGQTFMYESKKEQLVDPRQVYMLVDIMKDVVRRGTGTRAQVAGIESAGKTGTTNDYRDAWFCGFTPSVQTIVWFGNDNNAPLPGKMTGGVISAPVYAEYVNALIRFRPEIKREFERPVGVYGEGELFTDVSKITDNTDANNTNQMSVIPNAPQR
jgi:penicillin-binding protein 1A